MYVQATAHYSGSDMVAQQGSGCGPVGQWVPWWEAAGFDGDF